jgi:tRNA threonylcarbamoyladenosine biosynthesis protein TsaB
MVSVIALDSSTPACSVAVRLDGQDYEVFEVGENLHSTRMLPMVRQVLKEVALDLHEFDCIAVGVGPGSFTGLRIGVGIAQGLATSAGLPVVPVSSLAGLAQAQECDRVLPGVDARMGEIYWAGYQRKLPGDPVVLCGHETVSGPEKVRLPGPGEWLAVGTGWTIYAEMLAPDVLDNIEVHDELQYPHASDIAALGETGYLAGHGLAAASLSPSYVRNKVAKKVSVQK